MGQNRQWSQSRALEPVSYTHLDVYKRQNWLSLELAEEDPFIPYVSDEEDIELKDGEFIRNISVNIRFYEGWDE